MKLLFDENLSPRLVHLLAAEFPDSSHPDMLGMRGASDDAIWTYARNNGFVLVFKDNDFHQKAFLDGAPPKVVWLAVGNAGTAVIAQTLRNNSSALHAFVARPDESLLVLELPRTSG